MKMRKIIALNIKRLRKERGIKSSRALAEEIDIAPVTLSKIEAFMSMPSEDTISKIAKRLGCNEAELFQDPSIITNEMMDGAWIQIKEAIELLKIIPIEYIDLLKKIDWSHENIRRPIEILIESLNDLKKKR